MGGLQARAWNEFRRGERKGFGGGRGIKSFENSVVEDLKRGQEERQGVCLACIMPLSFVFCRSDLFYCRERLILCKM
jgi:hypothetical protein